MKMVAQKTFLTNAFKESFYTNFIVPSALPSPAYNQAHMNMVGTQESFKFPV